MADLDAARGAAAFLGDLVEQRLVMGLVGASVFKNPPAGYTVGGATAAAKGAAPASTAGKDFTQQEAMRTPQWYLLTLILTISVTAGISLISVAAGTATDVAGFSAAEARRFFGPPPQLSPAIERDYLTPWPADTAEQRYLERFRAVVRN